MMTPTPRDRPLSRHFEFWLILLLALALRLVQLGVSLHQLGTAAFWSLTPDTTAYLEIAKGFFAPSPMAERQLWEFGPGYGAFLALSRLVFGQSAYPVLLLQIILSSMSCGLVYQLARLVTGSGATAFTAGILAALSLTAISLSCLALSDTLYFFIFLSALLCYLQGLRDARWRWFVAAGLLMGSAVLIRAVGQLWPIMMLLFAVPYVIRRRRVWPSRATLLDNNLLRKVLACVLIVIAIEGAWTYRNYQVHNVAALTSGASGALANVATITLERLEGKPSVDFRREWREEYMKVHDLPGVNPEHQHRLDLENARRVFADRPAEVARTYFSLVWENLTAPNHLPRILLPNSGREVMLYESIWRRYWLQYVTFGLSLLGLMILLTRRQYRAALILSGIYAYYAAMIGFTRWQGSRLFFPGQIAWAVLVAVAVVGMVWLAWKLLSLARRSVADRSRAV